MLRVVVYDQPAQGFSFDLVQRVVEDLHRVRIERIGLAVKFHQRDTVEVVPAGDRASVTWLQRLAFFAEADDALRALYRLPFTTLPARLQGAVCDAIETRPPGFGEKSGYWQLFSLEAFDESIDADLIEHFEGSLDPVVSKFHGVIDADRIVSDLGDQRGGVAQGARQYAPGKAAVEAVIREQMSDPLLLGLFRERQLQSRCILVRAGFEIEDFAP